MEWGNGSGRGSTPRAVTKYYLLLSIFDLAFLPLLLATAIKLRASETMKGSGGRGRGSVGVVPFGQLPLMDLQWVSILGRGSSIQVNSISFQFQSNLTTNLIFNFGSQTWSSTQRWGSWGMVHKRCPYIWWYCPLPTFLSQTQFILVIRQNNEGHLA